MEPKCAFASPVAHHRGADIGKVADISLGGEEPCPTEVHPIEIGGDGGRRRAADGSIPDRDCRPSGQRDFPPELDSRSSRPLADEVGNDDVAATIGGTTPVRYCSVRATDTWAVLVCWETLRLR